MARPIVTSLYTEATDLGIILRLSSPYGHTLEVDYDQMQVPNAKSLKDYHKVKEELEERIEENRSDLILYLKDRQLIENFLEMLSSKSIDSTYLPLLRKCKTVINEKVKD